MEQRVICVIMGGGRGKRLYPLTKSRCKPAVPLGGKYRLVDIPISNCLNSGYNQIYILTQFNTASLHRHIQGSYRFDSFGGGFVDILSAEQNEVGDSWYQGTADAVRQNMGHFNFKDDDLFLILSGDQLYRMNFKKIIAHHNALNADVTISSTLVPKEIASSFGIMRVNNNFSITEFVEKLQDPDVLDSLVISHELCAAIEDKCRLNHCLASMGIYLFKASVLKKALESEGTDFGREIIPSLLGKVNLCSYVFDGYWEDIGTIRSFFDANLLLTDLVPSFNFFDASNCIYTNTRHLPASKINSGAISHSILANGCIITDAEIRRCVISVRSIIREGSYLENVFMIGADNYEGFEKSHVEHGSEQPLLGIGRNCKIYNTIIDKNARIGDNVYLSPEGKSDGYEEGDIYVKDGVLIVLRNGVVPDNTVIAPQVASMSG